MLSYRDQVRPGDDPSVHEGSWRQSTVQVPGHCKLEPPLRGRARPQRWSILSALPTDRSSQTWSHAGRALCPLDSPTRTPFRIPGWVRERCLAPLSGPAILTSRAWPLMRVPLWHRTAALHTSTVQFHSPYLRSDSVSPLGFFLETEARARKDPWKYIGVPAYIRLKPEAPLSASLKNWNRRILTWIRRTVQPLGTTADRSKPISRTALGPRWRSPASKTSVEQATLSCREARLGCRSRHSGPT